jgi:hypothetical protein
VRALTGLKRGVERWVTRRPGLNVDVPASAFLPPYDLSRLEPLDSHASRAGAGGATGGANGPQVAWLSQITAVLKIGRGHQVPRGFESHPRRSLALRTESGKSIRRRQLPHAAVGTRPDQALDAAPLSIGRCVWTPPAPATKRSVRLRHHISHHLIDCLTREIRVERPNERPQPIRQDDIRPLLPLRRSAVRRNHRPMHVRPAQPLQPLKRRLLSQRILVVPRMTTVATVRP